MSFRKRSGFAAVELALVFPFAVLLSLMLMDLCLLSLRQMTLERATRAAARRLAHARLGDCPDLAACAEAVLRRDFPDALQVEALTRDLASPPPRPFEKKRTVRVTEVHAEAAYAPRFSLLRRLLLNAPFTLRARAREAAFS